MVWYRFVCCYFFVFNDTATTPISPYLHTLSRLDALPILMMGGEIIAGARFGSMALLVDGFHMATHVGALAIAAVAYLYARRHAHDARFTFGTGKLGEQIGRAHV